MWSICPEGQSVGVKKLLLYSDSYAAPMRLAGAASRALRAVLAAPAQRARWLGTTQATAYLAIPGQPGVLAVLAHDAVRLPCGLVLATTGAELPLTALVPGEGDRAAGVVGDGTVSWTGPAGPVVVTAVREWAPARAARAALSARTLSEVRALVPRGADDELAAGLRAGAVGRLLGRGPGLTPAGDDLLAGYLVGAHAFGLEAHGIRDAVARLAPGATTALSAALLWHAGRGECIDEVAAFAGALAGRGEPRRAVERLLAVGHTSGAALAHGVLVAAESSEPRVRGAVWTEERSDEGRRHLRALPTAERVSTP
jgi:Protein of unknown function (DUF2877)